MVAQQGYELVENELLYIFYLLLVAVLTFCLFTFSSPEFISDWVESANIDRIDFTRHMKQTSRPFRFVQKFFDENFVAELTLRTWHKHLTPYLLLLKINEGSIQHHYNTIDSSNRGKNRLYLSFSQKNVPNFINFNILLLLSNFS